MFSEFFSRVFLFYSERLFMCYFYNINFCLKANSGLICKKGRNRERVCVFVCVCKTSSGYPQGAGEREKWG